ncbi:MAG: hypothetical protein MZV64_35450 [Ignavibacteriales bacterium]|nr:hypothetical protein [Ignavibacteriales bacterium]
MTERFGASSRQNPDFPVDVEAEWLENIERFEEAAQDAELVTVRDYLNDPVFTDVKDIPAERLPEEIEMRPRPLERKQHARRFLDRGSRCGRRWLHSRPLSSWTR